MSVMKEGFGSRSSEVNVGGSNQSAAERQSAEAQVQTLISKFAPAHQGLVGAMRQWLRKRLPTANEVVYEYRTWFVISFSPSENGYEGVLSIRGDADGIKLYFNQGKELPDPEKLLKGTSQTRFIYVEDASALDSRAVARLIDDAFARNRVPFPSDGDGSIVIRPTSVKQRSRQPA